MLLIILFLTTVLPGSIYCFDGGSGSGSGDEVSADLCKLPDGVFPNPDNCGTFIRCQSGVPDVEFCSDGLLFNPLKLTCDYSTTGNCSEYDFEVSSRNETDDVACSEDVPNIYAIQSSCTEYYICENDTAYKVKCSKDLLMNAEKLTCDYPENVECDTISSTEESTVGMKAIYGNDKDDLESEDETSNEFSNLDEKSIQSETSTEVKELDSGKQERDENSSSNSNENLDTTSDVAESSTSSSFTTTSDETSTINLDESATKADHTLESEQHTGDISSEAALIHENSNQNAAENTTLLYETSTSAENKFISSTPDFRKERISNVESTTDKDVHDIKTSSEKASDVAPTSSHDYPSSESLEPSLNSGDEVTEIQIIDDTNKIDSVSDVNLFDIFTTLSSNELQQDTPKQISTDVSNDEVLNNSKTFTNELSTNSSTDEIINYDASPTTDYEMEAEFSTKQTYLTEDYTESYTEATKSNYSANYELNNETKFAYGTSNNDLISTKKVAAVTSTNSNLNDNSKDSSFQTSQNLTDDLEYENFSRDSQIIYTTSMETDTKIIPGKTLSTPQALMSSDPLTDNETRTFTTTTYSEIKVTPDVVDIVSSSVEQSYSTTEVTETSKIASNLDEQKTTEVEVISTQITDENNSTSVLPLGFVTETSSAGLEYFTSSSKSTQDLALPEISTSNKVTPEDTSNNEISYPNNVTSSNEFQKSSSTTSSITEILGAETDTFKTNLTEQVTSKDINMTYNFISPETESSLSVENISKKTDLDEGTLETASYSTTDFHETSDYLSNTVLINENSNGSEALLQSSVTTMSTSTSVYSDESSISSVQMNKNTQVVGGFTSEYKDSTSNNFPSTSTSDLIGESYTSTENDAVVTTEVTGTHMYDTTKTSIESSVTTHVFPYLTENTITDTNLKVTTVEAQESEEITEKDDLLSKTENSTTNQIHMDILKNNSDYTVSFSPVDFLNVTTVNVENGTNDSNTVNISNVHSTSEDVISHQSETSATTLTSRSVDLTSPFLFEGSGDTNVNVASEQEDNAESSENSQNANFDTNTGLSVDIQSTTLSETSRSQSSSSIISTQKASDFSNITENSEETTDLGRKTIANSESTGYKITSTDPPIENLDDKTASALNISVTDETVGTSTATLSSNISSRENTDLSPLTTTASFNNTDNFKMPSESNQNSSEITEDTVYTSIDRDSFQTSTENIVEMNSSGAFVDKDESSAPSTQDILSTDISSSKINNYTTSLEVPKASINDDKTDLSSQSLTTEVETSNKIPKTVVNTQTYTDSEVKSQSNLHSTQGLKTTILDELVTERSISTLSSSLLNTESILDTILDVKDESFNDKGNTIIFTGIENNSTSTEKTNFSSSTSEVTKISEITSITVSSMQQNVTETSELFFPETESHVDHNGTSVLETSSDVSDTISEQPTTVNVITNVIHKTSYPDMPTSSVLYTKDSFASTSSTFPSLKQNDTIAFSSLGTVSSEETTDLRSSTYMTLPPTHLNISDSSITTTAEVPSTQSVSNDIYKPSAVTVTLITNSISSNETTNPPIEDSSTNKTPEIKTTEFLSTNLNYENTDTSEISKFTTGKLEESTLYSQPDVEVSSTVPTISGWNTKLISDSRTVSSNSISSNETTKDFISSTFASRSTFKTSSTSTSKGTTVHDESFEPDTTTENELFTSDNFVSLTGRFKSTSLTSSTIPSETNETSWNSTEISSSTTDYDYISSNMNTTVDSKEYQSSTLNTTETLPSTAESTSSFIDLKRESISPENELKISTNDATQRTDLISKIESTSSFPNKFQTENIKESTEYTSVRNFSTTAITGSIELSTPVIDKTDSDKLIHTDETTTNIVTSDSLVTTKTLPEITEENVKSTSSSPDLLFSEITETKSTASQRETTISDLQTKSTTEMAILLYNDTTETTKSTIDISNGTITSRNLNEKTEATEYPSTYFPIELQTKTSYSSAVTVTKSKHRGISITDISTESTTMNVICLTPEGKFPYPGNCSNFYLCIKGVPRVASCVGNEHFDPVKKICGNPCMAKCDPNIDCGTTESTSITSVDESTSEITLSEADFSSTTVSHSTETKEAINITTPDYFIEDTTPNEINVSTFSVKTTEMLASTTVEEWTGSQTYHELSSSTVDISSTKDSTATSSDNYINSISTEKITTASDINRTISNVPITNTTVPYEITSQTQTEDIEVISSTTETSTQTEYETSSSTGTSTQAEYETSSFVGTSPETEYKTSARTETMVDNFSASESKDDLSSTSAYLITSTMCESEDCLPPKETSSSTPVSFRICPRNDFLAQPDCKKYLDCTGNVPKKLECPMGLHFNPTTRVCDWPYKAECGTLVKPLYQPTDSFKCSCKSCIIPSTTSCSGYYLCLGFTAYEMKCSKNLYFDRSRNTCNYAPLIDCNLPSSTTTTEMEPSESSTDVSSTEYLVSTSKIPSTTTAPFVCPSREGLFRYPDKCEMFYQCANWYPYAMHCPAATHFSESTKRCEYPCDAKCDSTLNCMSTSIQPPTRTPTDQRCSCLNCKLPFSESCMKYIVCVNGKARIERCPWGKTFDAKKSTCDWAHKVACQHSAMCPERNGIFPYKNDCHKFVLCSNGIHNVEKCPSILEFDPVKKRCEWPTGRCNNLSLAKELDVSKREEERRGWKCPKTFGYFADDKHCSKFYHCSLGTPTLKECSEGLVFNPRHQTCDWKKQVRCKSNRHQKPRRCRVFDHHIVCTRDRKPQPHPICNMFYDCTAGRACAKQCPVGLYFNNMTGICDLPENVKCLNPGKDEYSLKELSLKCASGDHAREINPANDACYYHCRQGKVVSGCCSKGHVYNLHKDKCERRTKSFKI